jgi:ribosomal protein L20
MSDRYKGTEDRMKKALDAYNSDQTLKIAPLAREYEVSYPTLYHQIHDRKSKSTREASNKALNKKQETTLKLWIQRLDNAGCSSTLDMIEHCANAILRRMIDPNDPDELPRTVSKM